MKISVIGTGYVGLSTALGFAAKGHSCICVDVDKEKINNINKGIPPFYEEGIEDALKDAVEKKLIVASNGYDDAVKNSEITFVCVGTPSNPDGSADLSYIKSAVSSLGDVLKSKGSYHVVCIKSTVLPGTTEGIVRKQLEASSGRKAGIDFGLVMNPEFLREGRALEDFLSPDRVVIGELDKRSGDKIEMLYSGFNAPIMRTSLKAAEMIKYASNAFLATKVTFINELGNLCKKLGIDIYEVARGIGYDKRISPYFLDAGCGFGGSCFPKDVSALASLFSEEGVKSLLIDAVLQANANQKKKVVELLMSKTDLPGKKIAILGLAFKEGTDDVRDSVAIDVISELKKSGAVVCAYDPLANGSMKKIFPDIAYVGSASDALKDADACLVLTAWPEFSELTDDDFAVMENKIIIEGRRILDRSLVSSFEGVCWQ